MNATIKEKFAIDIKYIYLEWKNRFICQLLILQALSGQDAALHVIVIKLCRSQFPNKKLLHNQIEVTTYSVIWL